MTTRDRDHSSAMLNSKLIHMPGQMVQIKRYDSSTSLADSGHGSSMSSRWSSRSSLHSNASLISNNSNTSRLKKFFGKLSLKKLPKKDTPKKPKTDNQNRIGGNNFSQKPLVLEGAAEQDTDVNENQVDFKEEDDKLVPDNQCQIDSNGRRRKTSSSDSTKSYESGKCHFVYKIFVISAGKIFLSYFRIIEC